MQTTATHTEPRVRPAEPDPAVPSQAARAAIAAHLQHEHGLSGQAEQAELERSYDGLRGTVRCPRCPGLALVVDPEPNPEALRLLARNPAVAPLLTGLTDDEKAVLLRELLNGGLGRTVLLQLERRARFTSRPQQPEVARKKKRAQAFLLHAYQRLGTVEKALDALTHLRRADPAHYRQIMGNDRLLAYDTLRGYWRGIPPEQRRQAKGRYQAAQMRQSMRQ